MTDPRIEAAARAMFDRSKAEVLAAKGFTSSYDYGEISEKDKEYWRDMIRPIIAAADAAAWRPLTEEPPEDQVLLMSRHGAVVAQWDVKIDGWRNEDTMYSPRYFTHWQPLPAPPASIAELGGVDGSN